MFVIYWNVPCLFVWFSLSRCITAFAISSSSNRRSNRALFATCYRYILYFRFQFTRPITKKDNGAGSFTRRDATRVEKSKETDEGWLEPAGSVRGRSASASGAEDDELARQQAASVAWQRPHSVCPAGHIVDIIGTRTCIHICTYTHATLIKRARVHVHPSRKCATRAGGRWRFSLVPVIVIVTLVDRSRGRHRSRWYWSRSMVAAWPQALVSLAQRKGMHRMWNHRRKRNRDRGMRWWW